MELTLEFFTRVVVAGVLGAIVGFEREVKQKPAGVKPMMIVSIVSCVFAYVSLAVASKDGLIISGPARIAAQIIPGIGFLGGGVIIKSRMHIHGLTTAASFWLIASIGLICGIGYLLAATILTATLLITLTILTYVDFKIKKKDAKITLEAYAPNLIDQSKMIDYFSHSPYILIRIMALKDGFFELRLKANNRNVLKIRKVLERSPCRIEQKSIGWEIF